MKPIKLVMQAFGPYAGMEVVDFEKFGEKGLFLVTGATGAGKTTIFDAISYALFNKTSGTDREVSSLRSDYATPEDKTFVEFTFSHKGQKYVIKRSPEYRKKKVRGEGTTLQKSEVILYLEQEKPIEKAKDVERKIDDILHLSYEQFKQISMIAQGEFRKVLTADSSERGKILQKIFSTQRYAEMQKEINKKASDAEKEVKNIYGEIEIHFKNAVCNPNSKFADAMDERKAKSSKSEIDYNVDEKLELLDRLIEEDKKLEAEMETQLKSASEEKAKADEHYTLGDTLSKHFSEYDKHLKEKEKLATDQENYVNLEATIKTQKQALYHVKPSHDSYQTALTNYQHSETEVSNAITAWNKAKEQSEDAQKKYQVALEHKDQADKSRNRSIQIEGELDKYQEREGYKNTKKELEQSIKNLETKNKETQDKIEKEKREHDHRIARMKELEDVPAKLEKCKADIETKSNESKKLKKIIEVDYLHLETLKANYLAAQKTFEAKWNVFEKAEQKYKDARKAYEYSMAGILASKLKDEEPCPVCGSLSHPSPAVLSPSDVTKEDVDKLEAVMNKARTKKDEALNNVEKLKGQYEGQETALLNEIQSTYNECKEETSVSSAVIELLKNKKSTIDDEIIALNKKKTAYEEQTKELDQYKKDEVSYEGKLKELNENNDQSIQLLSDEKQKLAKVSASLASIGQLSFETLEEAKKEIERLKNEADAIEKDIKAKDQANQDAQKKQANNQGTLDTAKKQKDLNEKAWKDYERLFNETCQQYGFKDETDFKANLVDESSIKKSEDRLTNYKNSVTENDAACKTSYKLIDGKMKPDMSLLEEKKNEATKKEAELRRQQNEILNRRHNNETCRNNIRKCHDQGKEKMEISEKLRNVSNLIDGKMSGKNRTSFETYVQMSGFDNIIRAANKRLSPLSGGQYRLYRHEDRDAKANIALDLDILDNYTGKKRPVSSLSGGESFMAALSLALGLSDQVTATAGGIEIDTLFIDEGFGTLDTSALNDSLKMLRGLSDSSKLIGIISHREELKEVIENKIIVSKTPQGSTIKQKYGD